MTCGYCEKPAHSRRMCQMHYRRWRLYGDALHKRRNRGVLDAPVTYPLGPAQLQVVLTLAQNPGNCFPWWALGNHKNAVGQAVKRIRSHFGEEVVEHVYGKGYRMRPEIARAVLR